MLCYLPVFSYFCISIIKDSPVKPISTGNEENKK